MSMDSVMGTQFMSSLSACSSPRLLESEKSLKSEDETSSIGGTESSAKPKVKVKLMCSYGGRIMPRPHDAQLRYVGGETRILVVSRSVTFASLSAKLAKLCGGKSVFPKYKLPYEDLDALVSVICDEDLEAMLEEYDRLDARDAPSKLRLFLFPTNKTIASVSASGNAEQQFVNAINGDILQQQQQQQIVMNTDFLFGFDNQAPDAGRGGGGSTSSGSAASMIMEADSATQSGLAPICTAATIPVPAALLQEQHIPSGISHLPSPFQPYIPQPGNIPLAFQQAPTENIPSTAMLQHMPQQPQIQNLVTTSAAALQQAQEIQYQTMILPPQENASQPAAILQHIPQQTQIQTTSPQILPPKGPKDKKDKVKKDKFKGDLPNSPDSGASSSSKKDPKIKQAVLKNSTSFEPKQQSPQEVLSTSTSIEESQFVEEVEKLKLDDPVKLDDKDEMQGKQPRTGSPVQLKEMSLNVFMEQQHKLEEALQKSKSAGEHILTPLPLPEIPRKASPSQELPAIFNIGKTLPEPYNQTQQVMMQYPITSGIAPLSQSQVPQVPQLIQASPISQAQPYYIENNMVYYLAPTDQQYMQRPIMFNEAGVHIQRTHSAGASQPRVVQASAPLQRQLSAAYVDQLQQLPVAPNRMVYYPVSVPVNVPVNMPRTNQATSRFREPVVSQQRQFVGAAMRQQMLPQEQQQQQQQQQQQYVDLQRLQQPEMLKQQQHQQQYVDLQMLQAPEMLKQQQQQQQYVDLQMLQAPEMLKQQQEQLLEEQRINTRMVQQLSPQQLLVRQQQEANRK